jgi:CheY-like chemotaxis protein
MNATRKVLVVDDDPVVRKSFDRVLSGKGYAVITAESGQEALNKLNEEKYDVVYTDIRMPGMSGLEVAEKIKARQPWTPVVIITGYGNDAAEARAKAAGVANFLHKPLSPELIEGSAHDALAAPAVAENVMVLPVAAEAPVADAGGMLSVVKNIALFVAAPFIGLAYIIALPIVGIGALAVLACRAGSKNGTLKGAAVALKHVAMVIAAPFFGLAYMVLFPFIGIALLLWMGGKAALASLKS